MLPFDPREPQKKWYIEDKSIPNNFKVYVMKSFLLILVDVFYQRREAYVTAALKSLCAFCAFRVTNDARQLLCFPIWGAGGLEGGLAAHHQ